MPRTRTIIAQEIHDSLTAAELDNGQALVSSAQLLEIIARSAIEARVAPALIHSATAQAVQAIQAGLAQQAALIAAHEALSDLRSRMLPAHATGGGLSKDPNGSGLLLDRRLSVGRRRLIRGCRAPATR